MFGQGGFQGRILLEPTFNARRAAPAHSDARAVLNGRARNLVCARESRKKAGDVIIYPLLFIRKF